MHNNTISRNLVSGYGGGICCFGSGPIIKNTVLWENHADYGDEIDDSVGWPAVTYCDIKGGYEGQGNIDSDPLFRDPEIGDFHLMSVTCGDSLDSPCIDAGDPSIFDYLLDCDWGLGYERSDMGAYGGQAIPTDIRGEHEPIIPMACGFLQNYPNPFNTSTIIRYSLPAASEVTISIYNILGRRVETLVEKEQPAGYHQVVWDASVRSSGMYFYRVQAGEYSETRKMVLLK